MITYTPDGEGRFRTAHPSTSSTPTLTNLSVANPEESDLDFILHAFDSALPYLSAIGSEAQWGTVPFTAKQSVPKAFTDYLEESYRLNTEQTPDKGGRWQHLVLYEVKTEDGSWRRIAAMGISTFFPDYVPLALADEKPRKANDYLYLNYLVSDRRTGDLAKGVGAKLVAFAEEQGRALNKTVFYGDCWRGNNDGLMKYYERMGFKRLGAFDVKDKHGPGLNWTGFLFSKPL